MTGPAARRLQSAALTLALAPVALIWLAPLYLMAIYATQANDQIFSPNTLLLPGAALLDNVAAIGETGFARALFNSAGIAALYTAISILMTSMAGYAFARFRFFGKGALWGLIVATLTVPYAVVVIPQYILVARGLGLSGTWIAVLVPPLVNALGVLFMRQSFLALPGELMEAARIDGAGEARIFATIALPLVKPALAALAIILFLASWNNYLWPLLVGSRPEARTAPVALASLVGLNVVPWGAVMAGASLMTLPMIVVFLALQRHFVAGITAGAVK